MALVLCGEEHELGEDFFTKLHPIDTHKALFIVDDVAEQAVWSDTS